MARWLRALAGLTEDRSSVPSSQRSVTTAPRDLRDVCVQGAGMCVHASPSLTHTTKILKVARFIKIVTLIYMTYVGKSGYFFLVFFF